MKSKRVGKPVFFVIFVLVLTFAYFAFFGCYDYFGDTKKTYIKGAEDIRWGIDISGGVEAVFSPDKNGIEITDKDMEAAKTIIETRLVNLNITDYEVYTDNFSDPPKVFVRFPKAAGDEEFDPQAAIDTLSASAVLEFYEGTEKTGEPFMTGDVVKEASYEYTTYHGYVVSLKLNSKGADAFYKATGNAATNGTKISIFLDDDAISVAGCEQAISGGEAIIYGNFTEKAAKHLSDQINAGSLPFALTTGSSSALSGTKAAEATTETAEGTESTTETTTKKSSEGEGGKLQIISPTLGNNALKVMVIAGSIAFGIVCLLMLIRYRMHGFIACLALLGQLAGTIACISGFFPDTNSFTLTVPGIAGIILSIGVGVDCNVIAAERIRDEFKKGKTIDGAIDSGFKNSLSAIIDGNVTIVIVSLVLMGAFGTPDSIMAKIFSPIMSIFGTSITGSIYAFGYTLIIGVIFNLIMGVLASKYMLKSVSQLKFLRKPALYGGKKNA
ncbi:MAG: protein translocase subunit SecD [Clostridia bacterium]|nr:protein translocase subunit SecD [Clostridia bacterium]